MAHFQYSKIQTHFSFPRPTKTLPATHSSGLNDNCNCKHWQRDCMNNFARISTLKKFVTRWFLPEKKEHCMEIFADMLLELDVDLSLFQNIITYDEI